MLTKSTTIEFKYIPLICLVIYVPFHLTEEALYNFPLWMSQHYNLSKVLSYPHWLINNALFTFTLFIGLMVYFSNKIKFLSFGLGILIWSLMNAMEHVVFSLVDRNIVPGSITAILFVLVSTYGFYILKKENLLNIKLILQSSIIAIAYWIIPISIIIFIGSYLAILFP